MTLAGRDFVLVPAEDMSAMELAVLVRLRLGEQKTSTEIANDMGAVVAHVATALERLEARGEVVREGNKWQAQMFTPYAQPSTTQNTREELTTVERMLIAFTTLDNVPPLRERLKFYIQAQLEGKEGQARNQAAFDVLTTLFVVLFGTEYKAEGPRLLKLAKGAGSLWALCELMIKMSVLDIKGDPHDYFTKIVSKERKDPFEGIVELGATR